MVDTNDREKYIYNHPTYAAKNYLTMSLPIITSGAAGFMGNRIANQAMTEIAATSKPQKLLNQMQSARGGNAKMEAMRAAGYNPGTTRFSNALKQQKTLASSHWANKTKGGFTTAATLLAAGGVYTGYKNLQKKVRQNPYYNKVNAYIDSRRTV